MEYIGERTFHAIADGKGQDRLWQSNKMTKRSERLPAEPHPLWQRVLAGERLPKRQSRHPRCEGTVEDHRPIALDVRELIRHRVFGRRVGSEFNLNLAHPWLRVMRLNSSSLDLQLVTGRTIVVPLVWADCGVVGERLRLECPLCGRRVCTLYHLEGKVECRHCNGHDPNAIREALYGYLHQTLGRAGVTCKSFVLGASANRATTPFGPAALRFFQKHFHNLQHCNLLLRFRPRHSAHGAVH